MLFFYGFCYLLFYFSFHSILFEYNHRHTIVDISSLKRESKNPPSFLRQFHGFGVSLLCRDICMLERQIFADFWVCATVLAINLTILVPNLSTSNLNVSVCVWCFNNVRLRSKTLSFFLLKWLFIMTFFLKQKNEH